MVYRRLSDFCLLFFSEDDGFLFYIYGIAFYSSLQPPFIMEKWCTGIVADMTIDCTVRFEVSCQRERKREKKAALELYSDEYHSSKDFSCHFPFLFFKTMTFFTLKVFNRFSTMAFFSFEFF